MFGNAQDVLRATLQEIDDAGLTKRERIITSPQSARIHADPGGDVVNFCANNYLGLADDPDVIKAAKDAMDRYGFGLASVLVQELEVHRRAVDLIGISGRRLRAPVCLSMAQAEGDAPSWMAALHAHASSLPPDDRRAFYSAMAQSMLQHAA